MSIAFGLHVNMNSFTSLQFDGRKLVSALYRIFQGTGTILVVVKQGEKTVKQSVLVPVKRARERPEENVTQSKSKRVPALQSFSLQTLVPAKRVPILQFWGPTQNLEEYNIQIHPKIREA